MLYQLLCLSESNMPCYRELRNEVPVFCLRPPCSSTMNSAMRSPMANASLMTWESCGGLGMSELSATRKPAIVLTSSPTPLKIRPRESQTASSGQQPMRHVPNGWRVVDTRIRNQCSLPSFGGHSGSQPSIEDDRPAA